MAKFEYDYYSGERSEQFRFLKVPKVLSEDPDYDDLGLEECVLYGYLLEHMDYSKRNGWIDEEGRTYVIHSLESVKKMIKVKSLDKARTVLNHLIEYGLIEKKRRGQGKPDLIYVKDFATKKSKKKTSEKRDDCGQLFSENEKSNVLTEEKTITKDGKNRILEVGKTAPKENNINNTEFNETPSILQVTEDSYKRPLWITAGKGRTEREEHQTEEYQEYIQLIRDNIDYDNTIRSLKYDVDRKLFDDFYNVMVDVVIGKAKEYKIHDTVLPAAVVRSRMLKLTGEDVLMAMHQFSEVTEKIRHVKKYMISVLYTSSITTQAYITNDVQYGMYGGGWTDLLEKKKAEEEARLDMQVQEADARQAGIELLIEQEEMRRAANE